MRHDNPRDVATAGARRRRSLYGPVLLAAGLYACILAYEIISTILLSFLLILLISLAANPIVLRLRQKSGTRGFGVAVIVAAFLIVAGMAAVAFSAPLKNSGAKFVHQFSGYWHRVQQPFARMDSLTADDQNRPDAAEEGASATAGHFAKPSRRAPADQTNSKPGVFQSAARDSLQAVLASFKNFAVNIASLLVVGVIVFFGVVFTLLNPYPIVSLLFAFVPEEHHPKAITIFQRVAGFVPHWALATLLAMLTVGVLVFLSMWPVFGFANALTLGFIAAVLESIPYLGPILSSIPALLLSVGRDEWTPLWVVLIYLAVYSLEAYVIAPLILADRLDLHPLAVIFSIFICGAAFGVLGVLIAVPALVIAQILYEVLYRPRFLPNVTGQDMTRLTRRALEKKIE